MQLLPADAYAMHGNRGQLVLLLPEDGVVMVRVDWTAGEYPLSHKLRGLLSKV
ncbi:MAG: hypothetical protein NWS56_02580 [Haliea sp.]|jgi:hypothetical protein|nr:hypothetical protein [Haliea sp.]